MQLLSPAQLSQDLRTGQSPDLTRRRIGIGLSLAGAAITVALTVPEAARVFRTGRRAPA